MCVRILYTHRTQPLGDSDLLRSFVQFIPKTVITFTDQVIRITVERKLVPLALRCMQYVLYDWRSKTACLVAGSGITRVNCTLSQIVFRAKWHKDIDKVCTSFNADSSAGLRLIYVDSFFMQMEIIGPFLCIPMSKCKKDAKVTQRYAQKL